MPMLCIAGAFRVQGTEPDGDSVRFIPNDAGDWAKVPDGSVRVNAQGGAQLRLDGIDALETHYTPPGIGAHHLHQPLRLAHDAAEGLLEWIGFTKVERKGEKVTAVAQDGLPGFILTRTADKYGRCVALVGRGDPPAPSGTETSVDVALLRETGNHRLISTGLAYPTFYTKLYVDLRKELADATRAARQASKGVFAEDETQTGVTVKDLSTLTDKAVILPKLFRRLTEYLQMSDGDPSLAQFKTFLERHEDRVLVISTAQKTGFDNLVQVSGQTVKLEYVPEDLMFDEG